MLIRPERREDAALIHEPVETAFKSAKVSSGTEEALVARVRAGRAYLPDLALVAEEDGRLLGQVMISRVPLRKDGRTNSVLLVAPLSVRLERRGEGIGSALMRAGLARGAELGYEAVFLVGDPEYYGRFGFKSIEGLGLSLDLDIPLEYVLGLELKPGFLEALAGGRLELDL